MNKKTILYVVIAVAMIAAAYAAFTFWKKQQDLADATSRVLASPALREEAAQRAAKNKTTLSEEAAKIANNLV